MARPRAYRSLLLTGVADAWGAVREEGRRGTARSGLVLMVASAALFALMAAVTKKLLPQTPIQAVVLSRGVMLTAAFAATARWQGAPLRGKDTGALLLRGLLGYAALSCYFWSVHHLSLGDAVLLQYSHPVFVAAIAPLFLGERAGRGHWGLVLAALAGVALIVNPSGRFRPEALVGVLGAMLSGSAYVAVRRLSRTEHPVTIMLWFPLVTVPFSLAGTLAAGRAALPGSGAEIAGHLLVTLTALLGQVALTLGLKRASAAQATAVTLTGPVFGLAFDQLLFGSTPSAGSLAGTAIVLTAVGLLGRRTEPNRVP